MGMSFLLKRLVFVATVIAVVAVGVHYFTGDNREEGGVGLTQAVAESTETATPRVTHPLGIAPGSGGFADIAEAVTPAVVNVFSERIVISRSRRSFPFGSDPFFDFFGRRFHSVPRERRETSLGSGVIVNPAGIVLTNNHVIEGAQEISIALADGREFEAKLLGSDPATDVAVLEIQSDDLNSDLPAVQLGDSDAARIGDLVLAIGNPFGIGQTVTMGIISATGRYDVGVVDYENFIQTDAAINPGNSGGALVDLRGRLIGINTAIFSRSGGYQGIGFAIPSNIARDVMESIISTGGVARGWLGLSFQDVDAALQKAFGLDDTRGAIVNGITTDGPADRAGLRQGDVVNSFQDQPIIDANDLRRRIALSPVGAEVDLGIVRGGQERLVAVTVEETTTEFTYMSENSDEWVSPIEGVVVEVVDRQTARRAGLREGSGGVVIKDILAQSPASYSGLRPGDIILEINRKSIASVEDFKQLVGQFEKQAMILLVSRGGRLYYLSLP